MEAICFNSFYETIITLFEKCHDFLVKRFPETSYYSRTIFVFWILLSTPKNLCVLLHKIIKLFGASKFKMFLKAFSAFYTFPHCAFQVSNEIMWLVLQHLKKEVCVTNHLWWNSILREWERRNKTEYTSTKRKVQHLT